MKPDVEKRAEDRIRSYYQHIDAMVVEKDGVKEFSETQLDKALKFFDDSVEYSRMSAGLASESYSGKDSVREFLREKRRLTGEHHLDNMTIESKADGSVLARVYGILEGKYWSDNAIIPVRLSFADSWKLNAEGLVVGRWAAIQPTPDMTRSGNMQAY